MYILLLVFFFYQTIYLTHDFAQAVNQKAKKRAAKDAERKDSPVIFAVMRKYVSQKDGTEKVCSKQDYRYFFVEIAGFHFFILSLFLNRQQNVGDEFAFIFVLRRTFNIGVAASAGGGVSVFFCIGD